MFQSDVLSDVCFGPLNFGPTIDDVVNRAKEALGLVGLGKECYYISSFELLGEQKHRVAFAGVLASNQEVLILDENVAGLY